MSTWVGVGIFLVVYLLPTIIAYVRGHRNRRALAKLNVLAGWTVFAWFTALVWSIYAEPSSYPRTRFQS